MRYTKDKLGRVKFTTHTQSPIRDFVMRADQMQWLRFLNVHGLASSEMLFNVTPKNRHNFSEQLKRLFDAGYVYKPAWQRNTEYPDGHFHIYKLTEKGEDYLRRSGLWVDALPLTGAGPHRFFIASVTGSLDVLCRHSGYGFVPAHEYLNGKSLAYPVPFAWEEGEHTLDFILDSVCAINYGQERVLPIFLEVNRNTEPNTTSNWRRKSDLRFLRQCRNFIGGKLYREAYGRESRPLLLYVTIGEGHAMEFRRLALKELGSAAYIATAVEDAFADPFYPPKLLTWLFERGLDRAGREPFFLDIAVKKEPMPPPIITL